MRAQTEMSYPDGKMLRNWIIAGTPVRAAWLAAGLAALGLLLSAGCSIQQATAQREAVSCSQYRLDAAQRLFLGARANLVRYYKERGLLTLNAAYGLAGDAIQVARATRSCSDFDNRVRATAVNIVRTAQQLRAVAISTMRDPGAQTLVTLLQEQYGEVFAGRDLD